jgi:nucleotide-binding universal stress UspA family protein
MTILVPTDFSPESLKAVEYAASLLAESPGTLHLVHVHDVDYAYALPSVDAMPPIISPDEIERTITADLKSVAARCGAIGESATSHVRIGRAFDQICAVAAEVNADLIVISTHGYTGLKHFFLGSTAERVVQHAPCPVLVVRDREREGEAEDVRKIRKILVPVDFSDCSRHGVSYAVALAKARGAAELICAHAKENNVDLIVTSTHGLTGFAHILIGSTAEHVVRYAKCPVLIVPRRERGAAAKPTV